MVSLRFSRLQAWLWTRDSVKQEQEEGNESSCKGKKLDRKGTFSRERKVGGGTAKVSGASLSSSSSAPQEALVDWSIGWYEPHGPGFSSDDSFAVLVPCYASPPQVQIAPALPGGPPSLSKSQLWADVLSKIAMETQAETLKHPSK
eukprot:c15206_g1_i1 orf=194-631(-)